MAGIPSYRESNRARLRAAVIGAARELTVTHGWDAVRMVDVARAAGVSRQTVYNEFHDRAGLGAAVVAAEMRTFVRRVRAELHRHGGDTRAATYGACLLTLEEAAANPLVRTLLTSGRGGAQQLVPLFAARSGAVLDTAAEVLTGWAAIRLPRVPRERLALAIEVVVRLTISNIMLPRRPHTEAATGLAAVFVRLLE
jgi:AcrR family transcriptional regulator